MPEVYEMCCINQMTRVLKAENEHEAKSMGICTLERWKLGRVVEEAAEVRRMLRAFWELTAVPSSYTLKVKRVLSETSGNALTSEPSIGDVHYLITRIFR